MNIFNWRVLSSESCCGRLPSQLFTRVKSFFGRMYQKIPPVDPRLIKFSVMVLTLGGVTIAAKSLITRIWKKQDDVEAKASYDLKTSNLFQFSEVSESEILSKKESIQIVNQKYGVLSLEKLKDHQLLPNKKMVLGDATYYFSDPFKIGKYPFVIGFVEIEGKIYPRLFYHSNSQGIWRLLPSATKDQNKNLRYFCKGKCETDIQLPIPLICALNKLPYESAKVTQFSAGDITKTVIDQSTDKSFLDSIEVVNMTILAPGAEEGFYQSGWSIPTPPEPNTIGLPENETLHPDFTSELGQLTFKMPCYGEVTAHLFASKDQTVNYMFYETKDGKVFLAALDRLNVKINSFGVRAQVIESSGIDTPLFEYPQQIPVNYQPGKWEYIGENYISAWNYVREIEIIKAYYTAQGKQIPGKV